ncbi:MAG: SGNH/GDSL hydrolase family protein [Bryobacteraceae bacterium]
MKLFRDLALAGLGVVVVLVCLEASLRLLNVHFSTVFIRVDPILGYSLRPNATGWEDDNYYATNSDGMRDRERAVTRPKNTLRIAVLGDSMTEAIQVPLEKTYVAVFERSLGACLDPKGPKIEALNFGVIGYNLAQDYLELREKVWKYDPQVVVVALGDNAPLENSRKLDPTFTRPRPYFVLNRGALRIDSPPNGYDSRSAQTHDKITALTNRFELAKLFKQDFSALSADMHHVIVDAKTKLAGSSAEKALPKPDLVSYLPPTDEDTTNAWAVTEAGLTKLAAAVREHGSVFQVFLVGMSGQLLPAKERDAFARSLGTDRLDYMDTRLNRWGAENGVKIFDAVPALEQVVDREHIYLRGEAGIGHFNVTGNYYLGAVLAREYCAFLRNGCQRDSDQTEGNAKVSCLLTSQN